MNYRQWKKRYKKIHGYNPPLKEDRRKLNRQAKKFLKNLEEFPMAYNTPNDFELRLIDALASACDVLSKWLSNTSDALRFAANNYKQMVQSREVIK